MENFLYYNPAKVIFGNDALDNLNALLQENNVHSLLLIYGGDYVVKLGIFDKVKQACQEQGIDFTYNNEVVPNPRVELVRKMINTCRENSVDFIIAAGGGSAIDTAKAIALGVNYQADVWDFFTKEVTPQNVIPIGVISTIPASGSETSSATIISSGDFKLGFEHSTIIPKFALLNPEFTLNLPPYPTACGIADMLSHMLERYYSPNSNTDTTDYLIEGAIKALLLNAKRLMNNSQDLAARSEIQIIGTIAHNGSLDIGRISCWGSHRIEHEISALYDIAHGEGMAIVLIAFAKYMADNKPARLAQLANRVFNYDYHNYSARELALKVADELTAFFKQIGLKTSLSELNIDDSKFEEMANKATKQNTSPVGHYLPLDREKIVAILRLAL